MRRPLRQRPSEGDGSTSDANSRATTKRDPETTKARTPATTTAKRPATTTAKKPVTTTRRGQRRRRNDQGEDHGGEPGEDDQGENNGNCTAADLTEGAVVKEAELRISNGQAVFEKVELPGSRGRPWRARRTTSQQTH